MDYEKYIFGPVWAKFRRRYFASGLRQSCLVCNSRRVTLHHITYERLGSERLIDVVPMCWDCHQKLHAEARQDSFAGLTKFAFAVSHVFDMNLAEIRSRLAQWFEAVPIAEAQRKKPKAKKGKKKFRKECRCCGQQRKRLGRDMICLPCYHQHRERVHEIAARRDLRKAKKRPA